MPFLDDIERILDFIQKNSKYEDRELLKKYIKEHDKYGTFDYAINKDSKVIAICRWNMNDDAASILDFIIDINWRNNHLGKYFIVRALRKFPKIKKIEFNRGYRGDERMKILNIDGILKRNIF